jgi:hypothetical protein
MCHYARANRHRSVVQPAERPPLDPIVAEPHTLRASDAERERVVEALRVHAGEGRLPTDELERRIDTAYAAERRGDLAALLVDLPRQAGRRRPLPRRSHQFHTTVLVAVLLLAIWALTGAGYFWPIWPIGAMALSLLAGRSGTPSPASFRWPGHRAP